MIYYEVNLELNNTIYEAFLEWLPNHIEEILNLECFKNAAIFTESSAGSDAFRKITVHYELSSMENLQNYFDNHAAAMREKTLQKFGDQFKVSRRVLKLSQTFGK
ncbi:MAG TPA: DUF4286 family protein [Gammaproteobacteria bacterium]|jgi:hypothetical protein|nr:DUF4286 family protein [Gammaproteobacteria bacterium]